MKITSASFETVILRFYLMMIIVVSSFVLGYPAFAVIAVPVFLSGLAGVSFKTEAPKERIKTKRLQHPQSIVQTSAA